MDVVHRHGISKHITESDVKLILSKHGVGNNDTIDNYTIRNASDKMLGFLCDYWKLKVQLNNSKIVYHYFLKVISVSNTAKAELVKELNLFEKELYFYAVIKDRISIPGLKSWSPRFITGLKNAMVFEDVNALDYKLRDKFKRFDIPHTLEALKTLARFHASSIVYEEKKSRELGNEYSLNDDFGHHLGMAGYVNTEPWYLQCMNGALEALKTFSKYTKEEMSIIEDKWSDVWSSALHLADPSTEYRNVVCHRDLWNNNIMFHYKDDTYNEPDHCVLVDFQAARYQPPAGDVMLLLCCNLDPKHRENNLNYYLSFYLDELHKILHNYEVPTNVISKQKFFESANEQKKWGLVLCACLMPQFWIDDDLTTSIFCDTVQFDNILTKNKAAFIKQMIELNESDYKDKVIEIFEEIADRYCLSDEL